MITPIFFIIVFLAGFNFFLLYKNYAKDEKISHLTKQYLEEKHAADRASFAEFILRNELQRIKDEEKANTKIFNSSNTSKTSAKILIFNPKKPKT